MQAALDQLTQSNHELLDLLKKQQAVLEDMQFDRRLQSRQIASLEERLEEALTEKHQLESKVAKLESRGGGASGGAAQPAKSNTATPRSGKRRIPRLLRAGDRITNAPSDCRAREVDSSISPATRIVICRHRERRWSAWHADRGIGFSRSRATTTSRPTLFAIHGKNWRVLWHNQDKPGKMYANTSALFINAFPKDDTIPQKVSAKLGTGGDSTELAGPGNYYLKIEASGRHVGTRGGRVSLRSGILRYVPSSALAAAVKRCIAPVSFG